MMDTIFDDALRPRLEYAGRWRKILSSFGFSPGQVYTVYPVFFELGLGKEPNAMRVPAELRARVEGNAIKLLPDERYEIKTRL